MILLDTNVVSELMRPGPDATVVDWVCRSSGHQHLSTVNEARALLHSLSSVSRVPDLTIVCHRRVAGQLTLLDIRCYPS